MIMGAWGLGRKPKLPYDAEVEYLESTGTQWIGTGINIDDNSYVLTCDFRRTGTVKSWNRYFGSYTSETAASTRVVSYSTYDHILYAGYRRRANSMLSVQPIQTGDRNQYALSYKKLVVTSNGNSTTFELSDPSGTIDTANVCIFGQPMQVFGFSIEHDGVLIMDLAPVRFTNELGQSEGAMYDRANPTVGMNPDGSPRDDGLYRNRGTDAFLWAEKQ